MKKVFKYLFIFISIFFTFNSVIKADDTVNYSCDYSLNNGFKFRVRVFNLPKEYLKSPQKIDNESKVKKYVVFYYNDNGSFKNAGGNSVSKNASGINRKVVFFKGAAADSMPSHTNEVQNFLIHSTLDANNIKCPTIYHYDYSLISAETLIVNEPTRTFYDDFGNPQTQNLTPATLLSMNCYESANSNPVQCSKVEVGQLVEEGTKECTYTANGSNRFKLIYDSNKERMIFDAMGSALTLAGDEQFTVIDGQKVLKNDALLNLFSSSKDKCPSSIKCSCNVLGKGCSFLRDNVNENCGRLVGEDGVDDDSKYGGDNDGKKKSGNGPGAINPNFGDSQTCEELLGPNLTKVVKAGIKIIQIAGAIIAIVNGMISLIPAVLAKDADGLQKASKKLITMAIILAIIFIFPTIIKLIGNLFKFDTSCIF